MKDFGMAIWTYMRDRVFGRQIFTSDGIDPFPSFPLDSYLGPIEKLNPNAVYLNTCKDPSQRLTGVLQAVGHVRAVEALLGIGDILDEMENVKDKTGYRKYLYGLARNYFEGFSAQANLFLSENASETRRLELLNILGFMVTTWPDEFKSLEIFKRELEIGTPHSQKFAAKILEEVHRINPTPSNM